MKISILHISDLHRDTNSPVSNRALLNSLINDIRRSVRETPPIPLPQLVVVSGDLIQGVGKDVKSSDDDLDDQYRQAEEFLIGLVDEFLSGDRTKLILVPGNHDVNFAQMYSSLEKLDYAKAPPAIQHEYAKLLFAKDSIYRWDWRDFSLYKIVNQAAYDDRFSAFRRFYNRFYSDDREYPERAEDQ